MFGTVLVLDVIASTRLSEKLFGLSGVPFWSISLHLDIYWESKRTKVVVERSLLECKASEVRGNLWCATWQSWRNRNGDSLIRLSVKSSRCDPSIAQENWEYFWVHRMISDIARSLCLKIVAWTELRFMRTLTPHIWLPRIPRWQDWDGICQPADILCYNTSSSREGPDA